MSIFGIPGTGGGEAVGRGAAQAEVVELECWLCDDNPWGGLGGGCGPGDAETATPGGPGCAEPMT
jgi:hypothetical protein